MACTEGERRRINGETIEEIISLQHLFIALLFAHLLNMHFKHCLCDRHNHSKRNKNEQHIPCLPAVQFPREKRHKSSTLRGLDLVPKEWNEESTCLHLTLPGKVRILEFEV